MICNPFKSRHSWEYFDKDKTAARCTKCGRSWVKEEYLDSPMECTMAYRRKTVNAGENMPCNREQFTKRETKAEKKNRLTDFLNLRDASWKAAQKQKDKQ